MRKVLLLCIAALCTLGLNAQPFVLTPAGIRTDDDQRSAYYKRLVPDKSAEELYKHTIRFMAENVPWKFDVAAVIDTEDGKFVVINGLASAFIPTRINRNWDSGYRMNFRLNMEFGEGYLSTSAIVIWPLTSNVVNDGDSKGDYFPLGHHFYHDAFLSGATGNNLTKESIEDLLNSFMKALFASLEH